ncbi:MAG: transporter substrate-binding domain-containing protein, partial [Xanthomonadales bacterium]|nr:transporter substrate-binding domain-containing protein [Xanthomonadales bacterium]
MQAKQRISPHGAPWRAFAALLFCGFMLAPALAATPNHNDAAGTIVLGGDAHYPPFQFINDDNQASGFDVALFRALAKQQHLSVVAKLGDWRNANSGLANGHIDVVPMFITPARSKLFAFSNPFLLRYHLVFARRGSAHISNLQQLAGRRARGCGAAAR